MTSSTQVLIVAHLGLAQNTHRSLARKWRVQLLGLLLRQANADLVAPGAPKLFSVNRQAPKR